MAAFKTLRFLLTYTILWSITSAAAVKCPPKCNCSWLLDSLEIRCNNLGLDTYPNLDDIPVEHLDLSGNNFKVFPTQYADIDTLILLDLSNNKIDYIEKNDLIGFTSLRTLLLANNSFTSWAHLNPNEAFKYATSLHRLNLRGNHLSSFNSDDSNAQLQSQTLTELDLAACDITSVGGDQLVNNLPSLERLVLSHNRLLSVSALPSRSLRVLELANCSLQRVSASLIAALPALEKLDLAWNTAMQFVSGADMETVVAYTLSTLDISYCNLDSVDLSGLPNLSTLHARSNMLRTLTAQTFANNSLLEILDLSQNALSIIELDTFARLKRLTKLDLAYNVLSTLDRNTFRGNDALVALNLSHNVFQKLTRLVSNSLREINLSWCEIEQIDSMVLSSFSTLQRLYLSHNLIAYIPNMMHSETLQLLDLSNCRLSAIGNNTFRALPELATLYLNGNRFTNPMSTEYFRSNRYLDQLWLADNPWICSCNDPAFIDFYDFLTAKPQKLKDKSNLRCASPTTFYGKTWEGACMDYWAPAARSSKAEQIWSGIMITIMALGALALVAMCFQKYMKSRKEQRDQCELESNHEEMQEIRRLNQRLLQQESQSNAPSAHETNLPSYEDALRMPKLVRPVKSMLDLTANDRARKRFRRSQTVPDGVDDVDGENSANEHDLQLDTHHRFRSVEMLSNRDKERTAQYGAPQRRTGYMEYNNNSGSRRFSIENSRFPAAHLKSQNLQSAEKIGNFQSYENSPYTKRKPKIAEIPPFKRANLRADSVEFLTDPEYDDMDGAMPGKVRNSPFAKRKPKFLAPPTTQTVAQMYTLHTENIDVAGRDELAPAIEDYYSAAAIAHKKYSTSTEGSDFQVVIEPEVSSMPDDENENRSNVSTSEPEMELERHKRKKRKNSASRRVSGNFAAAAEGHSTSSSSDSERERGNNIEPTVVVHKPLRETLF